MMNQTYQYPGSLQILNSRKKLARKHVILVVCLVVVAVYCFYTARSMAGIMNEVACVALAGIVVELYRMIKKLSKNRLLAEISSRGIESREYGFVPWERIWNENIMNITEEVTLYSLSYYTADSETIAGLHKRDEEDAKPEEEMTDEEYDTFMEELYDDNEEDADLDYHYIDLEYAVAGEEEMNRILKVYRERHAAGITG